MSPLNEMQAACPSHLGTQLGLAFLMQAGQSQASWRSRPPFLHIQTQGKIKGTTIDVPN